MRRFALAALAALALAATTACEPVSHDVELDWTFAGGQSCAQAGVATIQVDLAGADLFPNTFSCDAGHGTITTGADLGRFLRGQGYRVTVTGLDARGIILYRGTLAFDVVDGPNNLVTYDVPAFVQSAQAGALFSLDFAGRGCGGAQVDTVHIAIDGQLVVGTDGSTNLACNESFEISPLDVGSHTADLEAFRGGQLLYSLHGISFTVSPGAETTVFASLVGTDGQSATAALDWTFAGMGCAMAQVDEVQVTVDGQSAGTVPCNVEGIDGATVLDLAPGMHTFAIAGLRQGQLVYLSSTQGVTASFLAGLSTRVAIDAPAGSPGVGGAWLSWRFPSGGPDCSNPSGAALPLTITLRDAHGNLGPAVTATCGGPNGSGVLVFCSQASGCTSYPPLAAGNWTLTVTAGSAPAWSAQLVFGVPNDAANNYLVAFTSN